MEHRLAISRLEAEARVIGGAADPAPMERRLGAALSGGLPAALGAAVAPLLPESDAVLRIRRMRLAFALADGFDETELARIMAAEIAAGLREALAAPGPDARRWEDAAAYMAAYVEHRLGLAPQPDWAFPDFAPLRYLAGPDAAAELLSRRPALLPVLAASGRASGAPARIAERIGEAAALRLAVSWAARRDFPEPPSGLSAGVAAACSPGGLAALSGAAPGRALLSLALSGSDAAEPEAALSALLEIAALELWLALHPEAETAALAASDAMARLRAGGTGRLAAASALGAALAPKLEAAAGTPAGRARLSRRLEARRDMGGGASGPQKAALRSPVQAAARHAVWRSERAGHALLLPGLIRLGGALTQGQARDALAGLLPDGAGDDPGLLALLPPPDPPGPTPELPVPDPGLLAEEARGLADGLAGSALWSAVLLAALASSLPGLRASSRGYLQRQFLDQPGRIESTPETLAVTLDGPPLGIVLRMGGLCGPQGRLRQHGNRQLILDPGGLP